MRDDAGGLGGWLRRLGRKRGDGLPARPGTQELTTGEAAVLAVARAACDVVFLPSAIRATSLSAWGRPVLEIEESDAAAAVAAAVGTAMTGQRVAVVLPRDGLAPARDALSEAARWCVPLVVVAPIDTGTVDAAAPGAFVLAARNAQDAADLLLVAHRAAELTLTPGVVALDHRETARAVQDVRLPSHETVREWLGSSREEIESPSPAQELLFGPRRARVPAWFDPDRPAARGGDPERGDAAAALAAREVFFHRETGAALADVMERLSTVTGRELSPVRVHRARGSKLVLVASGSIVETADAVVDQLRFAGQRRLGSLGVSVLRPFPKEALSSALTGAEVVTAIDRIGDASPDEPPLARHVAADAEPAAAVVSARVAGAGAPLDAAALAAACRNMSAGSARRPVTWLGVAAPPRASGLPRQDVLAQRLARDYGTLEEIALPEGDPFDVRPEGARTVALVARAGALPHTALLEIAAALRESVGPHVRARELDGPGRVRLAFATACPEPFGDPGDAPPADMLLLAVAAGPEILVRAAPGARVYLATGNDGPISTAWHHAALERGLVLLHVEGGARALLDGLPGWLSGGSEGATRIEEHGAPAPERREDEPELPLAVRRYASSGRGYDDVSRFWGEHAQPRIAAGHARPFADPFLAVAATPPATSTFHDATRERSKFPRIDPSSCTACGLCWVSCPDSAIAPVALSTEDLLNAAFDAAGIDPAAPATAKLRRASRQLAAHVEGQLVKNGHRDLEPVALRESFDQFVGRLSLGDEEAEEARRALGRVGAELARIPLAATEALFHAPHRTKSRSGALLGLAVSPQACQGCGLCAAVCDDDAIEMRPENDGTLDARRAAWRLWEGLPDTPGTTLAEAGASTAMSPLAAVTLSRHSLLSLVGGDRAEPGSGQRVAVRQVAAIVEYARQRTTLQRLERLEELTGRLREALRAPMTEAVEVDDLDQLERALAALPTQRASVSDVVTRLGEEEGRPSIEVGAMQDLVRVARDLETLRERIASGAHGLGRARYGVLACGPSVESWAGSFGSNPFTVPVAAARSGRAARIARGLAEGLLMRGLDEVRLERRARLLLDSPADLDTGLAALHRLSADDMADDERRWPPPLLVLLDESALAGEGAASIARLLETSLPVKIVVLDGRDLTGPSIDAALLALSRRDAYVASSSIGHAEHLYRAVHGAITHCGPALLHLHAPSPRRHGFAPEDTIARARSAVACRVHPLFLYDPEAGGVFGSRLNLDGNPSIESTLADDGGGRPLTPADWALGERRFEAQLEPFSGGSSIPVAEWIAETHDRRAAAIPVVTGGSGQTLAVGQTLARATLERADAWRMLQELAGVVTPFTAKLRADIEDELRDAHRADIEALKEKQHEFQFERLRDRLLELAGVTARRAPRTEDRQSGTRRP